MDAPRALRTYRGTDPTSVMSIINSLSAKCRLLASTMPPECLQVLSQKTQDGKVTVMRVGAMGGVDYGIEYVTVEGGVSKTYIVIIASSTEKHNILVKTNKNNYDFQKMNTGAPGSFEINEIVTSAIREACASIIPGTKNYVSVSPGKYDDWHDHSMTYEGIPSGCSESEDIWRPYGREWVMTPQMTYYWHGSMSPVTAAESTLIASRYIDQQKRNYFPYKMVMGETSLLLPDNVLAYYGKKPYTDDLSYGEEIVATTQIDTGIGDKIAIQFFWPFIPYVNEIGHLNLLDYDRGSILLDGSVLAALYVWELRYYTMTGEQLSIVKFTDTASFNNSTYNRDYATGEVAVSWHFYTGTITEDILETTSAYDSSIEKNLPMGTLGNKEVAYVKTELMTSGSGPVLTSNRVDVTTGNFPIERIVYGQFVSQFGVGHYRNDAQSVKSWQEVANNIVDITQKLMFGDDVIAEGSGTMEYEMARSGTSNYQGYWEVDVSAPPLEGVSICNLAHINYTTNHMAPGGSHQTIYAHMYPPHLSDNVSWAVIGKGTLDNVAGQYGEYIDYTPPPGGAPDGKPPGWNCTADIDTIILYINGSPCGKLEITLDGAPGFGVDHAFQKNARSGIIARGVAFCERVCLMAYEIYDCTGVLRHTGTTSSDLPLDPDCYGKTNIGSSCGSIDPPYSVDDIRTGGMLSGGCCPDLLKSYYVQGWVPGYPAGS